jgi:hypothetical protein
MEQAGLQNNMTQNEESAILMQCITLRDQGKEKEAIALQKKIPLPPWLAKSVKDSIGADFLITEGYDLTEANKEYGENWLAK